MSCLHVLMLEHTLCLSSHVPHRENCIWDHPLILLQLLCSIVFSVAFRGSSVGIFKFSQHHNTLPVFFARQIEDQVSLACFPMQVSLVEAGPIRGPQSSIICTLPHQVQELFLSQNTHKKGSLHSCIKIRKEEFI